jgi:CRP/FNR family transcriptional regulator, dissimilatory nitrate respiration regulator
MGINEDQILKTLSGLPDFSEIDPALLKLIAEVAIQKTYQPGEFVFLEGEPCLGLYIAQEGWLRAVKTNPSGRELVVRYVGPGDTFNEIGVLSGGVNWITVEALEAARLIVIPRQAVLDLIDQHPALAKAIIQNLAGRILHAMNMVVELSLHSVESRLALFLLEEASGDYVKRKKWATQAAIASHLGTVPVVINRAFRAFVEDGLIALERDRIHILNREELQRIASAID